MNLNGFPMIAQKKKDLYAEPIVFGTYKQFQKVVINIDMFIDIGLEIELQL